MIVVSELAVVPAESGSSHALGNDSVVVRPRLTGLPLGQPFAYGTAVCALRPPAWRMLPRASSRCPALTPQRTGRSPMSCIACHRATAPCMPLPRPSSPAATSATKCRQSPMCR